MRYLLITLLLVLTITSTVYADTTFINHDLGYKAYLPDNWVMETKNDSQHYFYDTSDEYGALLSIVRYTKDTTYDTPEAWTRSHFIAYKMYMDYYPFGTVLFSDTSETETQGTHWATEMYLRFYTDDTTNYSWDEYTRYTATEKYGWELYAIGDTSDLSANIGFYGAVLKIIEVKDDYVPIIVDNSQLNKPVKHPFSLKSLSKYNAYAYTPLGRRIPLADLQRNRLSHGLYIIDKRKNIILNQFK